VSPSGLFSIDAFMPRRNAPRSRVIRSVRRIRASSFDGRPTRIFSVSRSTVCSSWRRVSRFERSEASSSKSTDCARIKAYARPAIVARRRTTRMLLALSKSALVPAQCSQPGSYSVRRAVLLLWNAGSRPWRVTPDGGRARALETFIFSFALINGALTGDIARLGGAPGNDLKSISYISPPGGLDVAHSGTKQLNFRRWRNPKRFP
jgi:hypothetical protein